MSKLDTSDEKFVEMRSRAEKAEEEGCQLRIAMTDDKKHESLMVQNLSDQIVA